MCSWFERFRRQPVVQFEALESPLRYRKGLFRAGRKSQDMLMGCEDSKQHAVSSGWSGLVLYGDFFKNW